MNTAQAVNFLSDSSGEGTCRADSENKIRIQITANLATIITSSDPVDSAGEGQRIAADSDLLRGYRCYSALQKDLLEILILHQS